MSNLGGFHQLPLRRKLMVVIMATTAAALLLSGITILISDAILFRGYLERDLSTLSDIVADNSTAALAFEDPRSAAETLGALRARPHVVTACVYRNNGTVLAVYRREGSSAPCAAAAITREMRITPDDMTLSRPILHQGRHLGTLTMLYDLDQLYERLRLYGATVLLLLLVSTLLALILSSRLSAIIAAPISQLVQTTTAISATKDCSVRAGKFSADELGVLVDAFNEMLAGIQTRDKGLREALIAREQALEEAQNARETSRLLASIVESSGDAIVGHDLDGHITSWNTGAEQMFGYSAEEAIGRTADFIAPPGEDEMPGVLQRICRGERIEPYQGVHRTKSGKVMNVSVTVSPIFDALGRIVGASKITRDITDQVRAAARLAQLNADLQRSNERLARSNEDLERFAFIASHDLQEPLRMIGIYSQLLVKKYPPELTEEAAACIDNIVGGAKRMRELLADLLAFTEIGGRPEDPPKPVDLNVIVENVIENLTASIEETGAVITFDPLPVLVAHDSHFVSLFQNLVGNALKYRGERSPRIHISVSDQGGQLRISVADNGAGIAPQYHDKIFVAFKRLHGKTIPGTGIGLAICQRVVQRYGGRIWVDSEVGKGSTFIFTLPDIRYSEGEMNERPASQS
jgi:PAS domain S-box-containing protein